MQDRDLITGVLAAQAGFATPSQVLSAAAKALVDSSSGSLLAFLQESGALSAERRKALEALVDHAVAARKGPREVAAEKGAEALLDTLVATMGGAVAEASSPPGMGAEVPFERPGQYTRLREVGRGSQSVVRAARDEVVGREVALKELADKASDGRDELSSRAARARFLREVRLVASLDHPGIIAIHELARREDGTLFCAQKLIRGETLQARLVRCGSLAERLRLLRHVLDACQAMAFAHAKRIVHRDLKPSNVMVGEYGETVVVDWGLAKRLEESEEVVPLSPASRDARLTMAGIALGTPAYMSPEQARGDLKAIDARSDVFSLGAILYQVLTSRPPFEGATSDHVLENVRAGRFSPVLALAAAAPPELAAVAERALRPDPSARYPDAEALAKELSAYLSGGRVGAYRYGTLARLRKFAAGHRALTAGAAVALGALLVSAAVVAFRLEVARRELASSFVERAHIAERESDWALAAGYFAAARVRHDTDEARWGIALAGERAIERILSTHGPVGSFTDVDTLPDGRVVVLAVARNRVEVRELDGGKVLWSRELEAIAAAALLPGGQLRLSLQKGWAFFDAAMGRELEMFGRGTTGRPCPGPYPTPVTLLGGQLRAGRPGVTLSVLAKDVAAREDFCAVSADGRQVAYLTLSGQVRLLSLPDGRVLAERAATGLRGLLFSSHGLVVLRQGWLEVLGGPGGDFAVSLTEAAAVSGFYNRLGGQAISPDGHLIAVARFGSSRADVVDLRTRNVRATIHYAPGWPRFAFSRDGQQLFAAGLRSASQIAAWRLPRDEVPTAHPGPWPTWSIGFSPSSRQLAVVDTAKASLDLYGARGELLARSPISKAVYGFDFVRDGLVVTQDLHSAQLTLRDVERGRDVWTRPCQHCNHIRVSADGTRLIKVGLDGLEVWDAKADRVLFTETVRVSRFLTDVSIAPDGRRVAWTEGTTAYVRDLESGSERTVQLDSEGTFLKFAPDSARIAVIASESVSLVDASSGRILWTVPHASADQPFGVTWSPDGRFMLIRFFVIGTELFDAQRAKRLARFPATGAMVSVVRPDLGAMLVATESNWELRPLPAPASDSPAESLARTLGRAGLALEGVELVAAP